MTINLNNEEKAISRKDKLLTARNGIFSPESLKSELMPMIMLIPMTRASNSEWQMIL
jgi:hypothetical protein